MKLSVLKLGYWKFEGRNADWICFICLCCISWFTLTLQMRRSQNCELSVRASVLSSPPDLYSIMNLFLMMLSLPRYITTITWLDTEDFATLNFHSYSSIQVCMLYTICHWIHNNYFFKCNLPVRFFVFSKSRCDQETPTFYLTCVLLKRLRNGSHWSSFLNFSWKKRMKQERTSKGNLMRKDMKQHKTTWKNYK